MRFVQIEIENGETEFVNVENVVTVIAVEGGGATLELSTGRVVNIFETADSFISRAEEPATKLGH